ncbi:MAG: hypothetical protein A2096_01895 [Spirochaetes bacterium GWF1_41_5]|nr:MAG: hypothetical protein A2096_01895 [Spirochaetes bacterium GWF1_41_5]
MKKKPHFFYTAAGMALLAVSHVLAAFPFTETELREKVFSMAKTYFAEFQHPETGVLYGARLSTKASWTTPADCKAKKPQPWGYGSRYADTMLHTGHTLIALLDAQGRKPDPFLETNCKKLFSAMKFIYNVCPVPGIIPRGPHPDDKTAYYDDSSMDQNTTFIIATCIYINSALASETDKEFGRKALQETGGRLEKYGWSIKQADGVTESHVGFAWTGMRHEHVSILLPTVWALYKGTGDQHWLDVYNTFSAENNGERWKLLAPGTNVVINGHPIYANQNCFRLNAFYRLLDDTEKKKIIYDLLAFTAKIQLERDFPNDFMRKFLKPEAIEEVKTVMNWGDNALHGACEAWAKYSPEIQKLKSSVKGTAFLAHVRFPLGGFHMVMTSEHDDLINTHIPQIWNMLAAVDLTENDSGETSYLFTVVAMHLYDYYYKHTK